MFWVILLVVVVGFAAWRWRVPLLAKLTGQDRSRIERRLNRRK